MPKPDLFGNHGIDNQALYGNSPSNISKYNVGDSKEVIKQLYSDKKTLKRQLLNVSQELSKTQNKLKALMNSNDPKKQSTMLDSYSTTNDGENAKLKDEIKNLKGTIKTLKTQCQTINTVLEAKKGECNQQKNMIANYEQQIATLANDKERLELEVNKGYDQKEDILVLYQVKEEEVKIAQDENQRLRDKLRFHAESDKGQLLADIQRLRKQIEKLKNEKNNQ